MKNVILLLAVIFSVIGIEAQPPAASGNRTLPAMQAIGRLYGKIADSTGKGVEDASVLLLQSRMDTATKKMKDVLLRGVRTQANGDFNMEDLPVAGDFKLNITATGFQPLEHQVKFTPPAFD